MRRRAFTVHCVRLAGTALFPHTLMGADAGTEKKKGHLGTLTTRVQDPKEQVDLSGKHPDVVTRMAQTLEAWRDSCRQSNAGRDGEGRSGA